MDETSATDPFWHVVITEAWTSLIKANHVENLVVSLDECGSMVSAWNKEDFGIVTKEIKCLQYKLKLQASAISRRVSLGEIR